MASRKDTSKVIDFTSYIPKNKNYKFEELDNYYKEFISLIIQDELDIEKVKTILGIFLSLFVSSISFDIKNNKVDKFLVINLFTSFVCSKYKDFSLLIKCIDKLF